MVGEYFEIRGFDRALQVKNENTPINPNIKNFVARRKKLMKKPVLAVKNEKVITIPKKIMSDIVLKNVSPKDDEQLTSEILAEILVTRLGLKRKKSVANHAKLLLELLKLKKKGVPVDIGEISRILGVSVSQTYEEIRKWRTLGILEFVSIPRGDSFIKGYMLSSTTVNRLIDRVESSISSFLRKTKRIAKDFDDIFMLEFVRSQNKQSGDNKIDDGKDSKENSD